MRRAVALHVAIPALTVAVRARGLTLRQDAHPCADAIVLARCDGCSEAVSDRLGQLRAEGWHGPVMLLVESGAQIAEALDAGAEDAAVTGADVAEIAARLARIARRRPAARVEVGPLVLDPLQRKAYREGRPLDLLPREYALLSHLAQRAGETVSRADLLAAIWKLQIDPGTNVVQVHISRLRARLDRGFATAMLHTDIGKGYRLDAAHAA